MDAFPETFSIIDTETTGMRPPFSRVIDIGIIRVERGEVVGRLDTLLNPGISIPSYIRRFTDITDEDLQDAPSFEEVALQVEALLKGAVFVAHNAPFDYAFLKSEFRRLDMEFSAETLCSVRLSRALFPKERSHSLESIINRYQIPVKARHRAMPDAQAVWDFFKLIDTTVESDAVARAVRSVRQGGDSPAPRVARDSFTDLPDSAGVYFFYGPEQELLYVGKSKHIRTRARSHFHGDGKKEAHLKGETTSIASLKTSGELSALILEASLIKKESPLYNRALRKRKKLVIAKAVRDANGYDRIVLERIETVNPDDGVLSVFRTTTQGKTTLKMLAREHRLCLKLLGIENGGGACFGYQLGTCDGACVGKEPAEEYDARVAEAFAKRRLRTWPYKGTVMIDEKESEHAGTVFFIDNWALRGAFRYEGDEFSPLIESVESEDSTPFDYDTYKILVRFMANPKNKRAIAALSPNEFRIAYARATNATEERVIR
ncbi:MAG: hypothetical protein JWL88_357 [Parcubacteria group bacterium]|nr:hypothetical protein [Parcubacteria group bacterium]